MNKYSSIVLWIGLIIIILNLAKNWTVLKDIIYAGTQPTQGGNSAVGGLPGPNGTKVPGGAGRHGGA